MGTIWKRKDGRYQTTVYVPDPLNPSGKKIPKYLYGKNRPEIKRLENELKNRVYKRTFADAGIMTVGEYLDEWFKVYAPRLAITTQELYGMYIRVHLKPFFNDLKMNDAIPMHIQQFMNSKDMKGQSVNKLYTLLNRAFKDAVLNHILYVNPCDGVKKLETTEYKYNIYDEQKMSLLLDAVKGTLDEVFIVLAGYCGMRRGEILGLEWSQVDAKSQTITINKTITRFKTTITKSPKSKAGNRVFIAPSPVFDVLSRYRKSQGIIGIKVCDKFTPSSYSRHFSKLLKKHNLEHTRFHDLRHYAATIMMKYNVPDLVSAAMLGHSDTNMTKKYQHVLMEMEKSAAAALTVSYNASHKV